MWALCCTEPATNDSDVVNVQEGEPLLPAGEVEQAEITKISERTPEATLAEEVKAEESKPEKKKEESKPEKKVSLSANPAEAFEVPEIVCNRVTTRSRLQPLPTKQRNAAQQGKTSAPPAQSPEQRDTTPPPPPPRGGEGERKTDRASQKSGISTQRASVRSSRRASAISSHSTASAMFLKGFMDVRRRNRTSVVSHHHGRVTDDYELLESLGVGGFGEVFRAKRKQDDHPCAIKSVDMSKTDPEVFQIELDQARQLQHPNVVRLLTAYKDDSSFLLVMEIYNGGDLLGEILKHNLKRDEDDGFFVVGIPDDRLARYAYQMFSGLAYLHYHKIVHRDIKAENYMRTSPDVNKAEVVLIDLGVSANLKITPVLEDAVGTLTTMAPEVFFGEYDQQCDLWSVGITLYMASVCMEPWNKGKIHMTEDEMQDCLCDPAWFPSYDERRWGLRSQENLDLVQSLLQREPEKRPTARQVLATNKWISGEGGSGDGCCGCLG